MNIIALSGKQQSGKDTIREYLAVKLREQGFVVFERNFADSLKEMVLQLFVPVHWGLTVQDLSLNSNKLKMLPCGNTIREVLQWLGTDICRNLYPKCWVNAYHSHILKKGFEDSNCIILTSDVRFPNEVEEIQGLGGKVIRLLRNPINDSHESETALDDFDEFDLVVDNTSLTIEEQNNFVKAAVVEKGWLE